MFLNQRENTLTSSMPNKLQFRGKIKQNLQAMRKDFILAT